MPKALEISTVYGQFADSIFESLTTTTKTQRKLALELQPQPLPNATTFTQPPDAFNSSVTSQSNQTITANLMKAGLSIGSEYFKKKAKWMLG